MRIQDLLTCFATLSLLSTAACTSTSAPQAKQPIPQIKNPSTEIRPNPTLPARAYTDKLGIVVELVPLKIPDGAAPQALLRITGVATYVAGVTFLSTRTEYGDWSVALNGIQANVLSIHSKHLEELKLLVPRSAMTVRLEHDPAGSAAMDIPELIADYLHHRGNGSLAKLATLDLDYEVSTGAKALEKTRGKFVQNCGKEVIVDYQWQALQTRADFYQANFCRGVLEELARNCKKSETGKREIAAKVDRISCRFSNEHEIRYEKAAKRLFVQSTQRAMNAAGRIRKILYHALERKPVVLKNANNVHIVMPVPHSHSDEAFTGEGYALHKQRLVNRSFWDIDRRLSIKKQGVDSWLLKCRHGDELFTELGLNERRQAFAKFSYSPALWNRVPYVLARDDQGIYYYIDRLGKESGGVGFRVFRGKRGSMSLTEMVDLIDDPQGMIFSTTKGNLRLVIDGDTPKTAKWISGKRSYALTMVPWTAETDSLIYRQLGVYPSQNFGTICGLAATASP